MHRTRFFPRALLAAAALAAVPCGAAQAQLRLEVTPFAGYMIDFDLEAAATMTAGGSTATGELRREIKGGPVLGLRAEAAVTPQVSVYASAARGESEERHDTFFAPDPTLPLGTLRFDGYDIWMLSGGVSFQPAGPLFRLYAGPSLTRFDDPASDESTDHFGVHGGAALTFPLASRVHFNAGMDGYYVAWDDEAIGEALGAQYEPDVQAETDSEVTIIPVLRVGLTLRL